MSLSEKEIQTMTVLDLEDLLIAAYAADYGHTQGEGYETVHFNQMVEEFANDDFYPLHNVAKVYLTVDPELRTEIVVPMADNAVIAGQPDTTVRTFPVSK